jgi:hypothetical protein
MLRDLDKGACSALASVGGMTLGQDGGQELAFGGST